MPRCVGIRWRRRATVQRIDLKRTSWTFHSFTSRDELLSAVDALCRSCDRLVDHDVSGERGDV
jgi:transcriptional regulator of NAD metabolism